jgi:hypothetical protein
VTEQQTTTTPAAAPAETGDDAANLDVRAEGLIASIKAEQKSAARDAATEAEAEKTEAKTEAKPEPKAAKAAKTADKPKAEEPPAEAKTPEQIATERRERLASITKTVEEERAKVAATRAQKTPKAAPPAPAAPPAHTVTDEKSFFDVAQKIGLTPQKLADYLTKAQDPQHVAEHAAKHALTPYEERLAQMSEHIKSLEQNMLAREQQQRHAAAVEQARAALGTHVQKVAADAPLTARLLEKHPKDFYVLADQAAEHMPDGFTAQDVTDFLEEQLSQLRELYGPDTTPAPASEKKRTKEPAAAKANVGNRLAAERATTVEGDDEDVSEDLETRARKLKTRLAAAG